MVQKHTNATLCGHSKDGSGVVDPLSKVSPKRWQKQRHSLERWMKLYLTFSPHLALTPKTFNISSILPPRTHSQNGISTPLLFCHHKFATTRVHHASDSGVHIPLKLDIRIALPSWMATCMLWPPPEQSRNAYTCRATQMAVSLAWISFLKRIGSSHTYMMVLWLLFITRRKAASISSSRTTSGWDQTRSSRGGTMEQAGKGTF